MTQRDWANELAPRIVFPERATFTVEFRRLSFDHEWVEYAATEPDQMLERLQGATVVVSNKLSLRRELLALLPDLKLIDVAATGVNHIDLDYCCEREIAVCNVGDYATRTVPEHVMTLIFALRRNLIAFHEDVRAGEWQRAKQFCLLSHEVHPVHGATLGIIGYGAIGRGVKQLARAVGMRALVAERKGALDVREGRTAFDEVIGTSDVITLHCPLTEGTRNVIGAAELAAMKSGAILINTSRGGLVDEQALAEALKNGTIGGAGVDVLTEEPPTNGNVLLDLKLSNLIVTPHVAWSSRDAMQYLADQVIENIEAFMRGESRNRVV